MRIDADRCGSMRIDADRCGSMRIDADRCGSMQIDTDRCGSCGSMQIVRIDADRCRIDADRMRIACGSERIDADRCALLVVEVVAVIEKDRSVRGPHDLRRPDKSVLRTVGSPHFLVMAARASATDDAAIVTWTYSPGGSDRSDCLPGFARNQLTTSPTNSRLSIVVVEVDEDAVVLGRFARRRTGHWSGSDRGVADAREAQVGGAPGTGRARGAEAGDDRAAPRADRDRRRGPNNAFSRSKSGELGPDDAGGGRSSANSNAAAEYVLLFELRLRIFIARIVFDLRELMGFVEVVVVVSLGLGARGRGDGYRAAIAYATLGGRRVSGDGATGTASSGSSSRSRRAAEESSLGARVSGPIRIAEGLAVDIRARVFRVLHRPGDLGGRASRCGSRSVEGSS